MEEWLVTGVEFNQAWHLGAMEEIQKMHIGSWLELVKLWGGGDSGKYSPWFYKWEAMNSFVPLNLFGDTSQGKKPHSHKGRKYKYDSHPCLVIDLNKLSPACKEKETQ